MLPGAPQLQLETLFVLDDRGRIVSTREPHPSPGPAFMLIRGPVVLAWAVRVDVVDAITEEISALVRREPLVDCWMQPPTFTEQYRAVLGGRVASGPAFEFPITADSPIEVVEVWDEAILRHHFPGWVSGEIEAGAAPVRAIVADGHAVSACSCSRRSIEAAEAGLDTAPAFRGRGYAPRVALAWSGAVRASGRTPLYSTDWTNAASRAVGRKIDLKMYATDWSLY